MPFSNAGDLNALLSLTLLLHNPFKEGKACVCVCVFVAAVGYEMHS